MKSVASVEHITIEACEPPTANGFSADSPGFDAWLRVRDSEALTAGFRGFRLGLIVGQPATVDDLIGNAANPGATLLIPPTTSSWGCGGALSLEGKGAYPDPFIGPDGCEWAAT